VVRKSRMSPGPTFTSVVPPPDDVPDSGSMTCTVASGMFLDTVAVATPSRWALR